MMEFDGGELMLGILIGVLAVGSLVKKRKRLKSKNYNIVYEAEEMM